jgi:hypothetical protein
MEAEARMSRSQKIFRIIWRIDGVLILVVAAMAALGLAGALVSSMRWAGHRRTRADDPLVRADADDPSSKHLTLGRVTLVKGTEVMQAHLVSEGGLKVYSGSIGNDLETRNVLFIDPGAKQGRWLLPDNRHVIAETFDVTEGGQDTELHGKMIATAMLVKPADADREAVGQLLLVDPPGRRVVVVADQVQEIRLTAAIGTELRLVFERQGKLVVASFDRGTLAKRQELQIEVPTLK